MAYLNAVGRDDAERLSGKQTNAEYLRHAARTSGRGVLELGNEAFRLRRGRGRLPMNEYVQYGVYNTCYDAKDRARFLSNSTHWPITRTCCDMTWQATTEDKWLCGTLLEQFAIPVPQTVAVIDQSRRVWPGVRRIETTEALRTFLTGTKMPLFGKVNCGICSLGAFLIESADTRYVHLAGVGPVDYSTLLNEMIGNTPYILQHAVSNHSFFAPFTNHLATVRVCVLVTKTGIKTPFCVLKLPSGTNIADSFWRPGNVACDVHPATGEVRTIRTKSPLSVTDHPVHPTTGASLLGARLPYWDRLRDLVDITAPIFASLRYQSMDIALTPTGPMLIEINTGGGFDLPQLASGRGFLTDEVEEFFSECGVTL